MLKNILSILLLILVGILELTAQTYNMTNGTVSTCSGTFYDSGGAGGNYLNGQNLTMTFCNPTPGQPIYVSFTSFNTENGWDYLNIYNGPNTGSPLMGSYTGAGNPGVFTATSGCITFNFTSDGSITYAGWVATISCTPPPPPPCITTIPLCGAMSTPFSAGAPNVGSVSCLFAIYNPTYYLIQPTTVGNLTITLQSGCDVDFALWGPFSSVPCNMPGTPTIDCSYSASNIEYADIASTVPGQYYLLLVSNYCNVNTTVNLTPSGSAAAGLSCGCTITANATLGSPIACNGGTTSVGINVTAGTGPFTYTISPSPAGVTLTGSTFNNVPAGAYTVTVASATCSTTVAVNVSQPTVLTANANAAAVLCNGGTTNITVSANGGTPGYQYSLNGGAYQGSNVFNVGAGTYTITVQDANGCTASTNITTVQPASPVGIATNFTNIACNGGTSALSIFGSGGTPGYLYSINGGSLQGSNTFVVPAGTYTCLVSDANGCTASTSVTITEPLGITVSSFVLTTIPCNGGLGDLQGSASGGAGTLTYTWNTTPPQYTANATGVPAGNYTLTVVDGNGCSNTSNISIGEPLALSVNINQSPVLCNGGNTGSATVVVNGGTLNYSYSWDSSPSQNTATASGLSAGTYTCYITDGNGCTINASIAVTEPPLLTVSGNATTILCNGNLSDLTITANGGTLGYGYNLNGATYQASNVFTGLVAGTYTFGVLDANGCVATDVITISEPPVLTISDSFTPIMCTGGTSNVTLTAGGGTVAYQYSFNGGAYQGSNIFTGILAGTYNYSVMDANGCVVNSSLTITEPTTLSASASLLTAIPCNGGIGDLQGSAAGGTMAYTYTWNTVPPQYTAVASSVTIGTYTLTVVDANACTANASVTITEPTALSASISETPTSCNAGADGTAIVVVAGGTPNYTYSWDCSPSQNTATATGLIAGLYTCYITDANGCNLTSSISVTEPTAVTVSAAFTPILCNGGTSTITLTAGGGNGVYQYSIDGGVTYQGSNVFASVLVGTYSLSVIDVNNCIATGSVTLTEPTAMVMANYIENCAINGTTYTASFDVSGGTPIYTVTGVGGSFVGSTFTSNAITTGTIANITVTDANGCTLPVIVTVGNCIPSAPCNTTTGCYLANQLIDGDFENFDNLNPFTNFTSGYGYYDCDLNNSGCIGGAQNILCQGDFAVETSTPLCSNTWSQNIADHTTGTGNMMLVDFPAGTPSPIYCTSATLLPNTNYCFGAFFMNLMPIGSGLTDPVFRFEANGAYILGMTNAIPEDEKWHYEGIQFNSGAGGVVNLCIYNDNFGAVGFDVAIDDIMLREVANGVVPTTVNDAANICDNAGAVTLNVLGNDSGAGISSLQLLSYPSFGQGNATADFANGTVTFIPDASFTGNATFTYFITTNVGCSSIGTIDITEVASPVANISGLTTFCQGASSTLDAGPGFTAYDWTTPSGSFNTQTVTATLGGTYTLIVGNANNCFDTTSSTVTINPLPTPVITTPSSAICSGASTTLDAGAGYTSYNWIQAPFTPLGNAQTQVVNTAAIYGVGVVDVNGCQGGDTITITVNANPIVNITPNGPTSFCPGNTVDLDAGVWATYSWSSIPAGATGSSQVYTANSSADYIATVTNAAGCVGSDTITIVSVDNIPPAITNCPANITQANDAGVCGAVVNWTALNVTDSCNFTIVQTAGLANGSTFPIGTTNVSYDITDAGGNVTTCSFTVTINDTEIPVISGCPANIAVNNDAAACGAIVNWTVPTVADNCTGTVMVSNFNSGANFPLGTTVVNYNATDASGNAALTCSFTVTVTDNENPVLSNCPGNMTLNSGANCTAIANWVAPTLSDNCPGVVMASNFNSGASFGLGTTTVTYTATDAAGNTDACSFTVTVTDNTAPTIAGCPANISQNAGPTCDAIINWVVPTVSDNCPGAIITQTAGLANGTVFPLGTTTVSYLATDAAGNTATCSFTVTITDNVAPVISGCPNNIVLTNDAGVCGAVATWTAPTAADNCTVASFIQTQGVNNGAVFPMGTTNVQYTATDAAGNTSTCSFTVTVTDTESPTVWACPNNITQQATGGCTAVVTWNIPTALDNCPGATLTSTSNSGDIFPIGSTVVTYTATDAVGNTGTCSFNVTILAPDAIVLNTNALSQVKCNGQSNGSAFVSASGGTGSYTYSWATVPPQLTATATGLAAGIYTVYVNDVNAAACVTTQSATVTITEPNPLLANASVVNDAICYGTKTGSATVSASGGTPAYTYTWFSNPQQYTATATNLPAGPRQVTVRDVNGCAVSATVIIGQPTKVDVHIDNITQPYCDIPNGAIAASASGGTAPYTYQWSDGQVGTVSSALLEGTYTVIATDANNCIDSTKVTLTNTPPPVAMFSTDPTNNEPIILQDATVNFTNLSTGAVAYEWSFGDGFNGLLKNPKHTYNTVGTFTVLLTAYNSYGMACPDTQSMTFIIIPDGTIYIPNVFTPNRDGENDEFFINGAGIMEMKCMIYDRWGRLVYTLQSTTDKWTGYNQEGKELPEGTYTYNLNARLNNGNTLQRGGTIMLIR